MGYLAKIENLTGSNPVLIQKPTQGQGEFGWSHRNGTFTLANANFGSSPFGNFPAPLAPRKWPWKVGVYGFLSGDAAHDALCSAIGVGVKQRLVYHHDQGYERVVEAVAYEVSEPYKVESDLYREFTVNWEINKPWTERNPVDERLRCGAGFRCGQVVSGSVIRCGQGGSTSTLSGNPTNVPTSGVDSSLAGPGGVPTYPDYGPIITIVGPYGGSLGFKIQNLSDPYQSYFNYTAPGGVAAGNTLVFDCGAKSILQHPTGGVIVTNMRQYISVPPTQIYWMSVYHGVANQFQVSCLGSPPNVTGGTINISWRRYFL